MSWADLGKAVAASLPPAFLLLVLINAAFLAALFWFLDSQMEQRMSIANRLLDHCLLSGGK